MDFSEVDGDWLVVGVEAERQHPPDEAEYAPQHELDDDMAASDLQKRVLFGSARHWAQVPGPVSVEADAEVAKGVGLAMFEMDAGCTSFSDGGGVNCERCGAERGWISASSFESSAQTQRVSSLQKPQRSAAVIR